MSIKLKGSSDGSVSFDAPADTSPSGSDITLTLPTSAGSANQFLKNSGIAGELEYSSMVEDSSGDIGVGIASPAWTSGGGLHLGDNHGIGFGDGGNGRPDFQVISTNGDTLDLRCGFGSDDADITITTGGNVGIGLTSPSSKTHIKGGSLTVEHGSPSTGTCQFNINSENNSQVTFSYDDQGSIAFGTASTPHNQGSFSEKMRLDSSGRLLAGTTSSSGNFRAVFQGNSGNSAAGGDVVLARGAATPANLQALGLLGFSDNTHTASGVIQCKRDGGTWSSSSKPTLMAFQLCLDGSTTPTERMRITNAGIVNIGNNGNRSLNVPSMSLANATDDDSYFVVNSAASVLSLNRQSNDGDLIRFFQAGSQEGKISVSGSTVSYNGGHLSRWSQTLTTAEHAGLLKGTVMTNLDEMCEWAHAAQDAVLYTEEDELPEGVSVGDVKTSAVDAYTEENEQLNKMAVSSVEGDPNVAGVMVDVDDEGDLNVAMTGDFVIRIAQGATVARGDLLMSAGDGTAKPQDDDIVRSKTIAKVTSTTVSTTYSDGSYCVPCVLMAC